MKKDPRVNVRAAVSAEVNAKRAGDIMVFLFLGIALFLVLVCAGFVLPSMKL